MPKRTGDPLDRLADKFTVSDGCWEWIGARGGHGYGNFGVGGRTVRPHRYVYELLVGPIPAGFELDHLCRNRLCVRPDHLEPVTRRENTLRGDSGHKTHCINGHAMTEDNIYRRPDKPTTRRCLTCHLAAAHRQRMRRKGLAS